VPLSADGGWGAWEIAGRFSHVDLNFREGVQGGVSPLGSVRGGEEDIWTIGVNWYLNANLRASLNYFMVDVDRLSPGNNVFGAGAATPPDGAQIGQDYDAIALRTQFTF
jgi:phosphate-selective porin OprO/OprP